MRLNHTITAVIRPGEQSGYVAECVEIPVVTQGATLDETAANLREAVDLHLDGEDCAKIGLVDNPTVVIAMDELRPFFLRLMPRIFIYLFSKIHTSENRVLAASAATQLGNTATRRMPLRNSA